MKFKVLFVLNGLGPGGAERSLVELIPCLARAGIESTVAFFNRSPESLEALFVTQGTGLRFLPERGFARRLLALRRLIRTEQPDIIHTALFESDVLGRLASIGQNAVVVSSLVNTPYDPICLDNRDINATKLEIVRLLDSWTGRYLTTHFHAVSQAAKEAAVDVLRLRPERITVIERGRNGRFGRTSAERKRLARLKLGLKDSDEVIINVGRQEYQKGQRFLINAMVEVARRRPQAVLLIAGRRGRQSQQLEEIQHQSKLNGQVRFLGHREDVPDVLASADLFAFPSLYKGLGGALIEAMALELPIVASRIPAIASVVEEGRNGLLVERATVAPLANAICDLLADRERARAFGQRSREIYEARFTLDRSAARMVDFYRRVARHANPALPQESGFRCE